MKQRHSFWAKWKLWWFKQKVQSVSIFTGSKGEIYLAVSDLVDKGHKIKSMTICQDFESYGHAQKFVCIVYHGRW